MTCSQRLAEFTDAIAMGTKTFTDVPYEVGSLYRLGFADGVAAMRADIAEVKRLADYWYERVTYTAAEIAEMRAKASDEAWQRYWDAGMPTDYPLEYSNEGATNA